MIRKCNEIRMCEVCNEEYHAYVTTARFCSRKCMYEWRKNTNWETVNCLNCNKPFNRRKNHKDWKTGHPTQYCSKLCALTSPLKKEQLKIWGNSDRNHWNDPLIQKKVKKTKLKKYGDENYNNMNKYIDTCMERYGVPYVVVTNPKSNGKRISKVQRLLYNQIKSKFSDAELEYWLDDVEKSVDIFIPSKKKVIEVFGTYWHCDPRKYSSDFYNNSLKKTAKEVWSRDEKRMKLLESLGYSTMIVWESDIKTDSNILDKV